MRNSEAIELKAKIEARLRDSDTTAQDLFPDIAIECSKEGIEKGKEIANALFAKGSVEESVRWFSKCIQLVDAGKVTGVPGTMRSVLHSNRAFAYLKLQKW